MEKDPRAMMDHDNQHWLALLRGEAAPEARPETVQEAQALRRAVLAESAAANPAAATPAGLERLLGDLHRQGLLRPQRSWWQRPPVWSLAAAALVVLALLPWEILRAPIGPPPIEKGIQIPQILQVSEPLAQAQALQAALQAAGLVVQHIERGSSQVLFAELPQPVPAAVSDILQHYGLTVPASGKLVVQMLPAGP